MARGTFCYRPGPFVRGAYPRWTGIAVRDLPDQPCKRRKLMEDESGTQLSDLGEDILQRILQSGEPSAQDLCRFACVSRLWKKLCYMPSLWQRLTVGLSNMREGVQMLASRCVGLQELRIDDPRCELHILHPLIVACGGSLRKVTIDCDRDNTSRNEASICSILWIISLYCKSVTSIELLSDGREGTFGYLENKAMWYLTAGFRSVQDFACLCRNSVTKQSVYLIVIAWRELRSLRVHCGALQMEDLMALKKCYSLRSLHITGARRGLIVPQNWDVVMHRELEMVTFTDSYCSAHDVVVLARLCPMLHLVRVNYSEYPGESPEERRLRFDGLKTLRDRVRSRMLELELDW